MRLFEVIVYVKDMDAMVRFYRDSLGLSINWPTGLTDYSSESWVAFDAEGATLALHSGGQGGGGTPPRFGFSVTGIEVMRDWLIKCGVECGQLRSAAPGVQVVDCVDPEGNGFFIEEHTR
jgi:catechol 2,3-dioxygenase-like lactoylglutathione lyase family enzyme